MMDDSAAEGKTTVFWARATYRKMIKNFWWASGYNIIAIPLVGWVWN